MNGTIRTYLPEKKYGFIRGDDGKDYFFHAAEFRDKRQQAKILDEALVSFDQHATPKGYQALNCSLLNPANFLTYTVPDEFLTSKTNHVQGWEVLELGAWLVHGSSRESPDAARQITIERARRIGANALIELAYHKTTGSEPGSGRGIHHFTIHNFRGRLVMLGKRNSRGKYKANDLSGLNDSAAAWKKQLDEHANRRKRKRNLSWTLGIIISFFVLGLQLTLMVIFVFIISAVFEAPANHDSWLEMAPT